MSKLAMLWVIAMVAVIVGADVLFFRHDFRARMIANIAIVIVFGVVYLTWLRQPR